MKYFCTLSDKNYACQGIALLKSLRRHAGNFVLYYLCLDGETRDMVERSGGADVVAMNIEELEKSDPQIAACRDRPEMTQPGTETVLDSYSQFCWALTPCWTNYLLDRVIGQGGISYLDSDLFFRQPLEPIFWAMDDKSVGIFKHRHLTSAHPSGEFNVGMVCFCGDEVSKKCARWWRGVSLNPKNPWAAKYGTCGDQKYLELFALLFGQDNIAFLDDTIGHGAPWNFSLYQYDGDYIIWNGKRQLLVFNHFSHFVPDFEHDTYKVAHGNEWGDCVVDPQVRKWYDEYFVEVKGIRDELRRGT
jgi:hypothetical protein